MEKILRNINSSPQKTRVLTWTSTACAITVALFFGVQLALHLLAGEYVTAATVAATAAIGYITVGVARRVLNAPRPYELYDFFENIPTHKPGRSFPSRHAYSAFVIATLAWLVHPAVSIALFILAILICVARVLTGLHFIRDVVAGALIGALTGVIGLLLVYFI